MIAFIVVTVLNSGHGSASETSIRTRDIKALRAVPSGCALSHTDFVEEIFIAERCSYIQAKLNDKPKKEPKSEKQKGAKGWF